MVFEHGAAASQAPAQRALTFLALYPQPDGITTEELVLPVKDEGESLHDAFQRATASTRADAVSAGFEAGEALDKSQADWRAMLDYVVKVLLYLGLDNAAVRTLLSYSSAPKEFPGLGRRKREAKLAEVEQLYDRYIVGPESLVDMGLVAPGERFSKGHELSAHWRRGHFRSQPYGPQSSMRKVMFISPTIVRADRLTSVPAG